MANNTSSKLDNSEFWQMCHDFHYNMPSISFDDNDIVESGDDGCCDADGFVYPPKAHSSPAKIVGVAIKRSLKNTVDLAALNRSKYYDSNSEAKNLVLDNCRSAPISHECDQLEGVEVFYECNNTTNKNSNSHDNNNNNQNFIQISSTNNNDIEIDNIETSENLLNTSYYSTADEIDASFSECDDSLQNLFLKKSAENSKFLKTNGYCVNTQKIIDTINLINDCDLVKSEIDGDQVAGAAQPDNRVVKVKSTSIENQSNDNNRKPDAHLKTIESVEKLEKPTDIFLKDRNEGINKLNGNDNYSNSTNVDLINDNLFDSVSKDIKKLKVSVQAVNDELEKTRKSDVIDEFDLNEKHWNCNDDGRKESAGHEHNHFEISVADCSKTFFTTDAQLDLLADIFNSDGK